MVSIHFGFSLIPDNNWIELTFIWHYEDMFTLSLREKDILNAEGHYEEK